MDVFCNLVEKCAAKHAEKSADKSHSKSCVFGLCPKTLLKSHLHGRQNAHLSPLQRGKGGVGGICPIGICKLSPSRGFHGNFSGLGYFFKISLLTNGSSSS